MSGFRGNSNARGVRGENRFYNPPHIRKQQEEERRLERERQHKKLSEAPVMVGSDECESSPYCASELTNLDRFLEYTTPVVPAQHLPKVIEIV